MQKPTARKKDKTPRRTDAVDTMNRERHSPLRLLCLTSTEGGTGETNHFLGPFCTCWTHVAITAPRRPKRIKHGPNATRVLGSNQPVAGFARRFGRLARQHVRCGAHMCLVRDKKSALGAQCLIWHQRRFAADLDDAKKNGKR